MDVKKYGFSDEDFKAIKPHLDLSLSHITSYLMGAIDKSTLKSEILSLVFSCYLLNSRGLISDDVFLFFCHVVFIPLEENDIF